MRVLFLLTLVALLGGCASTYSRSDLTLPQAKLERGKSIVIAQPSDGFFEAKIYRNSGRMTANAIHAAFTRYGNITVIENCKQLQCLQDFPGDYYVVPEILSWEDRMTEWSGAPDRLQFKITIYDGRTQRELASTVINGKSKWLTLGGDHPQDLLAAPLASYVESLF